MNANAKERDFSTKNGLCEQELASKLWLRDAFLADVIFRPYPAVPPDPKLAGGSDVPEVTTREVQAINASGTFLLCCKSPLRAASRVLAAHASSQPPNSNSKRQSPRTQNHQKNKPMNKKIKIVVIGGSGRIGSKVVDNLRQGGHEVVPASPSTGVNTLTGEGLADALAGADVVVDVANAPAWEDKAVLEFFETSGKNLLAAEAKAGVKHHVPISCRH